MSREIHDINTRALDFVVELIEYIFEYPDDDYMTMECLCRKLVKHGLLDKVDGYYQTHEIRTNTHECVKDTHDKIELKREVEKYLQGIMDKDEPQNYCDDCLYTNTCDSKSFFYACTSKANISKMEQVEDEPRTEREG